MRGARDDVTDRRFVAGQRGWACGWGTVEIAWPAGATPGEGVSSGRPAPSPGPFLPTPRATSSAWYVPKQDPRRLVGAVSNADGLGSRHLASLAAGIRWLVTHIRSWTAVRSASMPRLVSKQGCCASRDETRMPQSHPGRSQGGALLGKEGAVWDRQPVLFEQHRVSAGALVGSAPHC
jgi:hypothetical protein